MCIRDSIIRAYNGGVDRSSMITFSMDGLFAENNEEPYFEDEYYKEEMQSEYSIQIQIDDTLALNEIKVSQRIIELLIENSLLEDPDQELDEDFYIGETHDISSDAGYYTYTVETTIVGKLVLEYDWYSIISMSTETYNQLVEDNVYQAAVLVDGSYEADRVIKEIEELGFNAIYPAGISSPFEQIEKLLSGIGFSVLLTFFTFIIWVVSYLVLRNVQKAKQKDYLIFRSIGASKKDLNKITILELALSMTFSYIIVIILLVINEQFNTRIPHYLRYFTASGYLIIFAILMFLAYLLSASFNKRIFSKSVITSLKQE